MEPSEILRFSGSPRADFRKILTVAGEPDMVHKSLRPLFCCYCCSTRVALAQSTHVSIVLLLLLVAVSRPLCIPLHSNLDNSLARSLLLSLRDPLRCTWCARASMLSSSWMSDLCKYVHRCDTAGQTTTQSPAHRAQRTTTPRPCP